METTIITPIETAEVSTECKLQAAGRYLAVRKLREITKGGIHIPETAGVKPVRGLVLSVGEGDYDDRGNLHPMKFSVGQIVVFDKYTGIDLEDDGLKYTFIPSSGVLATIPGA